MPNTVPEKDRPGAEPGRGLLAGLARRFSRMRLRDRFAVVAFLALALVELYFALHLRFALTDLDVDPGAVTGLFSNMMQVRILLGLLLYLLLTLVADLAAGDIQRQRRRLLTANAELTAATRELERMNTMYKAQSETLQQGLEQLSKRNRDLSSMQEVMHFLSEKIQIDELLADAAEFLATRLWLDGACIHLWDQGSDGFVARSVYGLPQELVDDHTLARDAEPVSRVVASGEIMIDGEFNWRTFFAKNEAGLGEEYNSLAALPMKVENRIVGVFCGLRRGKSAFEPDDVDVLEAVVAELTLALQNAFLVENLRINALTDSLTQLYNHGYFQMRLREEIAKSRRYGRVFTLIMIDLDHFKDINDSYGHPMGDRVLVGVARLLISALRKSDIIARYGGEELAVILTETGKWDAVQVAERLRQGVEQLRIPVAEKEWAEFKERSADPRFAATLGREFDAESDGRIAVTASFGLAGYPHDGDEAAVVLQASDNALYQAKQQGRNRVVVAGAPKDVMGPESG